MNIELVKIGDLKLNKDNPRTIRDTKFKQLVKSIIEFPEMLKIRPIVVDDNMVVLGGNMRLKACKEAGLEEVYIIKADNLTEEQQKQFILKDNQSFGDWDYQSLGEWDKNFVFDNGFEDWELYGIYGHQENDYEKNINKANLKVEVLDVNDYIKQNIFFLNEYMIEFEDDEIKDALANAQPYGKWLSEGMIRLKDLPDREHIIYPHASVVRRQKAFGYTEEELRMIITPIVRAFFLLFVSSCLFG